MKYLFLFDIDGTILKLKQYRSRKIFRIAFADLFDLEVSEAKMPNFSGMTDLQIFKDICKSVDFPFSEIEKNIDSMWSYLIRKFDDESVRENTILMPSIDKMIEHLHNSDFAQLALVTGNFKANAYLKLSTYQLEKYFPVGAFGCDFADRNLLPKLAIDRTNLHLGIQRFNSKNSIIIGDSPNDIICAKANNIVSVAVATGFHTAEELEEYSPTLIFENFENYHLHLDTILSKL